MRNFSSEPLRDPNEATRIQPQPHFGSAAAPPASPAGTHSPQATAATANAKKVAVLGPTLRFKGELSAEEDFILQGQLEGSINHTQSVTIGNEGKVVGNIHARSIIIDGTVEGDLHGGDSVIVHESGHVTGNIFAPRVGIIEGAFFSGRVEMVDKRGSAQKPDGKRLSDLVPGVPLSSEETEKMLAAK
jgi:cytoskeletal protein CcmA (bactofilin family)